MRVCGWNWISWRDANKVKHPASLAATLLSLTLIWFRIPQTMCVTYEETARIHSVDYKMVKESLLIQTTISYSFSQATTLKIRVETIFPSSVQEQTVVVDAGVSIKSTDSELRPHLSSGPLHVSISLYLSNEKNEDISLLHVKYVDVEVEEAIARGQIAAFGPDHTAHCALRVEKKAWRKKCEQAKARETEMTRLANWIDPAGTCCININMVEIGRNDTEIRLDQRGLSEQLACT